MKIAIITGLFPKTSETFILNQIIGLIDLGHTVDVYAFRNTYNEIIHPEIKKYKITDKVTYFNIPENRIKRLLKCLTIILKYSLMHYQKIIKCLNFKEHGGKYHAINNLFILSKFINKQYDVIHCHFGPIANKTIFLKDIFSNTKFITTFHGYDIRLGLEKGGNIYKDLFRKADFIIAICRKMQEILTTKLGCAQNKVIYHPIGINIKKFINNTSAKKNNLLTITTVGRLVKEKNISIALKSIHSLRQSTEIKFQYNVIGDGYLKEKITQTITKLKLNDIVIMHGALSQDKIIEKLKETDIFLLTSMAEMLPNALLEAQAMRIPVVATDVGGVSEGMQENVSGYLISDFTDTNEIKNKLLELIGNKSLISTMGSQGRKFIDENYNLDKQNRYLVELYHRN